MPIEEVPYTAENIEMPVGGENAVADLDQQLQVAEQLLEPGAHQALVAGPEPPTAPELPAESPIPAWVPVLEDDGSPPLFLAHADGIGFYTVRVPAGTWLPHGGEARFIHVNGGYGEIFRIPSMAPALADGFAFSFRLRVHPHVDASRILVGGLEVRAPAMTQV